MKKRLITAAVMLAILLPLILIDNIVTKIIYIVLVALICAIGTYELMRAGYSESPTLNKLRFVVPIFSALIGVGANLATFYSSSDATLATSLHVFVLLAFLLSALVVLGLVVFKDGSTAKDAMTCILGLSYSGLMLGYAFSLRFFEPVHVNDTILNITGPMLFAYVYTIVVVTDSCAFIFGCKFGKHKLCPSVSPKKSVEGAVAGLIGGGLIGVGGLFLYGILDKADTTTTVIASLVAFGIALVISFLVQLGDLVESKLKRSYDIKDFGNILPGHGGILDRFDSFIYSGTFVFILVLVTELILIEG